MKTFFKYYYNILEGDFSAIGRSVVVFSKNGHEKLACANIDYDKDIIKYVNVRKTTKFETTHFFEAVRNAMGVPDWMLTVDSRKTKMLHNGACIQYLVHFKGKFYRHFCTNILISICLH